MSEETASDLLAKINSNLDDDLVRCLLENNYIIFGMYPTGEVVGVSEFFHTAGLCVGLDKTGYRTRFCYETTGEALVAFLDWNGEGDPPGMWIKEKGTGQQDRLNPEWSGGRTG